MRFIDYVLRDEGLLYYGWKTANVAPGFGIIASELDNKEADNSSGRDRLTDLHSNFARSQVEIPELL